jgi:hypothetical protein
MVKKEVKDKRIMNPASLRNLPQYKSLSDEEFAERYAKNISGISNIKAFEERVQKKIAEFESEYDTSDMKINDRMILRQLAQAAIAIEDYENFTFNLRTEGISNETIILFDKIQKIMSDLRKDISAMQDDLKITRKIRKGEKEESVVQYIETLKIKAKKFYENKHQYIFCPKCNMLLGTIWFLYPNDSKNKIQLRCNRKLQSGEICGTIVSVTSKELLEKRGVNIDNVPEYFK